MIPMIENKGQMQRMLEKAIKSVYASVFFNGSRAYLQTTGNLLSEEQMAVVIQSICGTEHNGYYYPMLSGVARSVNFYPIGGEKANDGIVNLAFGLGKTVVDGGNTLRFSPKYPRKTLQLSDPKLALRDTQKTMYALDLRPGAFKISRNDSINLALRPVTEALEEFPYPDLVASTYRASDYRIVPGTREEGSRIISFDAILKYGKFPLPQILRDLMEICRNELMSDVEIEFAADIIPESGGEQCVLKLLQVRPVSEFSSDGNMTLDQVEAEIEHRIVTSDKALGCGKIEGMRHIVYVPAERFDSARTRDIAADLSRINAGFRAAGKNYLLIGPGRWGSSDPWLGIPVLWSDISEARMIVECAIPGFRIEPSQGTHFFQNITSLGIGYLNIDTVISPDSLDESAFLEMEIEEQTDYVTVYRSPKDIIAFIDRNTSRAVAGI